MENKPLGYYMQKEINEIKDSLIKTITSFTSSSIHTLPQNIHKFKSIYIIACGTSYHSGLLGKKIIESTLNIPCETILANEFNLNSKVYNKNTLFIFISQSGKTTDVLNVLEQIKPLSIQTLAITNTPNSPLHNLCNNAIILSAGEEKAIASTKAFNCQILAFHLLCLYYTNSNKSLIKKLNKLALSINSFDFNKLKPKTLINLANIIKNQKLLYCLGHNTDFIFAQECALKLKETTYIHTIAMSTLEIMHGTLAAFNANDYVIAIITNNLNIENQTKVLNEIAKTGAKISIISNINKKVFKNIYDEFIQLPKLPNELLHLLAIIPCQWLALATSTNLNQDPDKPRRLVKAVV